VECVSEACVDFLLQQLTVENAVGFYTYARGYFLPRYSTVTAPTSSPCSIRKKGILILVFC
jgi:hypothetical protein